MIVLHTIFECMLRNIYIFDNCPTRHVLGRFTLVLVLGQFSRAAKHLSASDPCLILAHATTSIVTSMAFLWRHKSVVPRRDTAPETDVLVDHAYNGRSAYQAARCKQIGRNP